MNAIAAACVVYYSMVATAPGATQQQTITATHRSTMIGTAAGMTNGVEQHQGAVRELFAYLYQHPSLVMPFLEKLTASRACDTAYADAAAQLLSARVSQ